MAARIHDLRKKGCRTDGKFILAGDDLLKVSFRRTIRVPDDAKTALLPGDMGTFPLYSRSQMRSSAMYPYTTADFFFPMYENEAMFIHFQSEHRFAIKIFLGAVNVVSGTMRLGRKYRIPNPDSKQDYLVTPLQRWVDGIAAGNGQVTQFFASKTEDRSYSVDVPLPEMKQECGLEFVVVPGCLPDGILVPNILPTSTVNIVILTLTGKRIAMELKPSDTVAEIKDQYSDQEGTPPDMQRLIFASRQVEDYETMISLNVQEGSIFHLVLRLRGGGGVFYSAYDMGLSHGGSIRQNDMGLSHGGSIRQRMFKDPYPANSWNDQKAMVFTVQILNSSRFHELTGIVPPSKPMDPSDYKRVGYPYFDEFDDSATPEVDAVDKTSIVPMKSKIVKLKSKSAERAFDQYMAMSEQLAGTTNSSAHGKGKSRPNGIRSIFSKIQNIFTSSPG